MLTSYKYRKLYPITTVRKVKIFWIFRKIRYLCSLNRKVYFQALSYGSANVPAMSANSIVLSHVAGQQSLAGLHQEAPNARMAESVDALVSNTSGAIRAGSIPALGTRKWPTDTCRPFLYPIFPTFSPHLTIILHRGH